MPRASSSAPEARLGAVGRVLYVAAHPDDENEPPRLHSRERRSQQQRPISSMTRGDGGQNLVGAEQGPELGLIRTQELLAARRIDGAEQFFTRARDFGFSKSPDETLRIWGREAVLTDVVAVIRRFRPDVIITRFPPERGDTHGHHTASAMLAVEAFRAAADPKFHPEQLEGGTEPWQARRLLWNKSSWNLKPGEDLSGFTGSTSARTARCSASRWAKSPPRAAACTRARASATRARAGPSSSISRCSTRRPRRHEPGLASGHAVRGRGLALDVDVSSKAAGILRDPTDKARSRLLDATKPYASIPALLAIDRRARRRARRLHPRAAAASGGRRPRPAQARACSSRRRRPRPRYRARPGASRGCRRAPSIARPSRSRSTSCAFPSSQPAFQSARSSRLAAPGGHTAPALEVKRTIRVPVTEPATTPYWLDAPPEAGLYRVADARLIGAPENEPALRVGVRAHDRAAARSRSSAPFSSSGPIL